MLERSLIMKFLTGILSGTPELKELSAAVETGKLPAAVTGLSAVHKAAYIRTLSQMTGRRTLVLTGDEREAPAGLSPAGFQFPGHRRHQP